jgi:nitrite reductase/ring-hydroxylating ferredoxin subunit
MLGQDAVHDRLPYFFTDQYDLGMEYTGYADGYDRVVVRGDLTTREFIAFWLRSGRVVAGMNVNVWEVTDHIQALIRSRERVDIARLRDPDVPLKELAARSVLRDPERSRVTGSVRELVAQGLNFTRHFVGDRLSKADPTPVSQLAEGEARIMHVEGQKLAVHREDGGTLHALSPVCTHMGCLVEWNRAERTWDCPCHGSRFAVEGKVIEGPAKRPLEQKDVPGDRSGPASGGKRQ